MTTTETKYGELSNKSLNRYLEDKIGKIFKILPLYENDVRTLPTYIESLNMELSGAGELFIELNNNPDYITVMATLEYLIKHIGEIDKATCKREVFKCIGLIKQIIN